MHPLVIIFLALIGLVVLIGLGFAIYSWISGEIEYRREMRRIRQDTERLVNSLANKNLYGR